MPANQKSKTLRTSIGKRICFLCKLPVAWEEMRWSPKNHNLLAVMLASRVVFGGVDVKVAKYSFEACIAARKRICQRHFSTAAKYLVAELASVGVSLSHYDDTAFLSTAASYVTEKDIPKHLVDRLNDIVKQLERGRSVTVKDIVKYMNESAWRYYTGVGSDSRSELLSGIRENNPEQDETQSEETLPEALYINDIKKEQDSENPDYGIPLSELVTSSSNSDCPAKEDPNPADADTAPISPAYRTPSLPLLKKTDPKLLQYSFMVDGEALLKLFRFCPQCGQKLNADGAVRLVMDGAEPMVQYVCDRCSQEEPIIKTWKALED